MLDSNEIRQRKLLISSEAPRGFPSPSGSSKLPRAPPSLSASLPMWQGSPWYLPKALATSPGHVQPPSFEERKERISAGWEQARPGPTIKKKVSRSYVPPLAKQLAHQPGHEAGFPGFLVPFTLCHQFSSSTFTLKVRGCHLCPSTLWAQAPMSGEEDRVSDWPLLYARPLYNMPSHSLLSAPSPSPSLPVKR